MGPKLTTTYPILADFIPQGDGSWLVRPKKPAGMETWIGIRQASHILDLSQNTVQKYFGLYLVYRRPSPRKYLVLLSSVIAFRDATLDPEFWDCPRLKARLQNSVRQAQSKHAAAALQDPLQTACIPADRL